MGLILLATIPAIIVFIYFVVGGIRLRMISDSMYLATVYSLIIVFSILAPIQLIFGWIPETEWKVNKETPVVALKDGVKGSGSFYLGTGNKEDEVVYYYMTEGDFGKRMDYVYASNTHVKEVDRSSAVNPRIIEYEKVHKNNSAEFFFVGPTSFERTKTQIVVPKGTITDEFKIDME